MNESFIIVNRKMELYIDILINLTYKIYNTHPGYDCMDESDMWNHFLWCFKQTVNDFIDLDVDLSDEDISKILYEFYHKGIYLDSENKKVAHYLDVWRKAFNSKEIEVISYIYKIYVSFEKLYINKFDNVKTIQYVC